MTTLYMNLFCIAAAVVAFGLLFAVGIQLDFGQPEYAGPRFSPGYQSPCHREEWARDFEAVRAEIAAIRDARHERHRQDGWWADSGEFAQAAASFFAEEGLVKV